MNPLIAAAHTRSENLGSRLRETPLNDHQKALFTYLLQNTSRHGVCPPPKEIARHLGMDRLKVYGVLRELHSARLLGRQNIGRNVHYHFVDETPEFAPVTRSQQDLRACPFCGEKDLAVGGGRVRCSKCRASAPTQWWNRVAAEA